MNKKIIGIIILVLLIVLMVGIKTLIPSNDDTNQGNTVSSNGEDYSNLTQVKVATGGGKEGFLANDKVLNIMRNKYGINPIYDSWSNGKLIVNPLVREDGTKYDLMFCSDQRYYDYYKLSPDKSKGEAERYHVQDGGLILNTPIVIYSWDTVVDALMKENIVTQSDGTYYISDMDKLLNYILEGKKWSEIGLDLYGNINIRSTDPVTSSPGATYYGLILSIMSGGQVTEDNIEANLPKLKEFYEKSGYMNNTPADLFDSYLKTGMGGQPMIVDYEKSIVEFATSNPSGFEQVKDHIRILYPTPTIWNSHCIATFTDAGNEYLKIYDDPEIGQVAWEEYGFRTGVTGGTYDVSALGINGIPQSITKTVTGLKMNIYDRLIEYLK
ncbi:MAG: hypothetical protein K6D97_06225 [Clostridia bacterium]|nr:hypothetical protein [Clostridia bacterium]